MVTTATEATRLGIRWTTRIIPLVLASLVGLATYVVVQHVCIETFIKAQNTSAAISILVLYFTFLGLMVTTYVRTLILASYNPDSIPLGQNVQSMRNEKPNSRSRSNTGNIEAQRYVPEPERNPNISRPESNIFIPELENFYSKDVFVCEGDGRPRWCSRCESWKPDRVYHNKETNRCFKKLDHYCPWAGGIVSQSGYKFFVQFCFYSTLYCVLVLTATILRLEALMKTRKSLDGLVVAIIAVAGFFGLFAFTMTLTNLRYMCLNLTTVETLKQKSAGIQLAMSVPLGTPASMSYRLITYRLPNSDDYSNHNSSGAEASSSQPTTDDLLATRTFAIVSAKKQENPWDLGYYGNFKSVMGINPLDWFLPIQRSPCATHESNKSFYEMGPLYARLRDNLGLPLPDTPPNNVMLQE